MDSALTTLVVTALIFCTVAALAVYNQLVRSRNRVREAWSGIDVQLRRRASVIPNLIETVKGYAHHERETLDQVTRARGALHTAEGAGEASSANQALSQALGRLFAVAESYPQLRASGNFKSLQDELSAVEERIAFARQFYNRNVLDYNNRIDTFPTVTIARVLDFRPADFFDANDEGRAEVKASFVSPPAA